MWFGGRTTSLNDVVAESLGGLVGAVLWLAIGHHSASWIDRYATDRRPQSRLKLLLQAYLAGLVLYSTAPLDLTMSPTVLLDKFQDGRVLIVPFWYPYESITATVYQFFADIVTFVPVGALIVMSGWHRRFGSDRVGLVLAGLLISGAIEFMQLLVISRFTDVTDVLLGTLGVLIGGSYTARLVAAPDAGPASRTGPQSWSAAWPLALGIFAYSAFLAGGFLFPFDVTDDRQLILSRAEGFFRVPFLSLYQGTSANALKQLLVRLLLFAPLGAMWAGVASRCHGAGLRRLILLFGLVYSGGLAVAIEALQVLMPSKIVDSTDALLCLVGAAGGLYLTTGLLASRRLEAPAHIRVPERNPMVAPAESKRTSTTISDGKPAEDQPIVEVLVKGVIRRLCGSLAAATGLMVALTAAQQPQQNARFVVQHDWVGKGQWMRGDTHVHTRFSDGGYSPAEVARRRSSTDARSSVSQTMPIGKLKGASPEYMAAIQAVRKTQPALTVIAGLEWNVPPFGGDEHATLLVPEGPREESILAEFKRRFDDYDSWILRSPTFRRR